MRTIGSLLLFIFILIFSSCQKSVNVSNGTAGADRTTNSSLLQWINVNTNGDSITNNFEYNENGFLQKTWTDNNSPVNYLRDTHNRIIKIYWLMNATDSSVTNVFYVNDTSTNITYSVSYSSANASIKTDSTIFTYTGNKVNKAIIYSPDADSMRATYYYNFQYDEKLNLIKLQCFSADDNNNFNFNIGYTFEYDDKVNPFYSHDDVLIIYQWYMASPNNMIKQTNHYYAASGINDDYVNYVYQYNADNKPVSAIQSGRNIANINSFYFYK